MKKSWLFVSSASLLTLVFSASVFAQPATAGAADAGAPAASGDAGVTATSGDAATTTTAGDGGATATAEDAGQIALPPVPTYRRPAPPAPPPSPQQIAALKALQQETDAYAEGAKEYRDTVTTIIKLHYEEKKKDILSGLDTEIATEKAELKKARDIAIQRLEEFIAKYSGPNAQPEATPDAMFRLASLYEERARGEDATDDLSVGLKPAISLYKRVINEFPKYKRLAAIYYYLGHAYNDSARIEEAQQVWRSLVCHNKFPYPTPPDPKNADVDSIIPMPQDNTKDYWMGWRQRYPDPMRLKKGPDTVFNDPFPNDCQYIPQPDLQPGEDPKYVAEIWWQIGNWEFDQLDNRGGVVDDEPIAVWDLNRAASAYVHSLQYKKPPLYGVALYKYAWTLFKQQRYELATRAFVKLLLHTDELEKEGDTNVGDFRSEAYTYIAGSLTNVDFTGPGPDEPFIQRPDIVDTEPDPARAEKKLHVAIDRVRDPSLIPQDKPWTIEIYKSLAGEFRSLNQFNNAIEVYDLILKQWPMDPTAPDVQNEIALTYDQMLTTLKQGTPEFDAISSKALKARTALANYIGNTPWVDANKENPAALQNAERLVRGGLRQAAAAHTNLGKQLLVAALNSQDPKEQLDYLTRAEAEYRLAAVGWYGYLKQDENAPDAYDTLFWLADARNKDVRIQLLLHTRNKDQFPPPSDKDVEDAKAAAIQVRDSNEDDKYLDVAAQMVVEESDIARDLAYQLYDDSKGTQGVQKRTELEMEGTGDTAKVKVVPIPAVVKGSMDARDDYIRHVPPEKDPAHNSTLYAFDVADTFFVYGDFLDARARFEPIYKEHCGKDEYGYKAWEKLISIAAKSGDSVNSRKLAEAEKSHSCAVTAEQTAGAASLLNPIFQAAAYKDADQKFIEACGRDITTEADRCDPVTPDRAKKWAEAGALYEAALKAAPGRREAPRGAMRAAFAYKQLGDYDRAIKNYDRFISEYGKEETLRKLQKGDPKTNTPPEPALYKERINYLQVAYDEEGTTYYSFFSYPQAAATYAKVAENVRLDEDKRKVDAKNAMILFNAIGQRDKMLAMYKIVVQLRPTADERANYDYLVASYDYQQWNKGGADTGSNRTARLKAISSLEGFYNSHKAIPSAAKYALEAAWRVAKMKQAVGDTGYHGWFKNTLAAWNFYHQQSADDANKLPYADYGAEAEYVPLDEEIHDKFDYDTGHHHYIKYDSEQIMGKVDQKTGKFISEGLYRKDAKVADDYDKKLAHIVDTYKSLEWVPAALARRGSLYDSLRTGLYYCAGAEFKLIPTKFQKLLNSMRNSGRDALVDQADDLEAKIKQGWRDKRDSEVDAADQIMVRYYAQAVALSRAYNVRNPGVARAVARLAYFTDLIGDPKMATYVSSTNDPTHQGSKLSYTNQMYVQTRPGLPETLPENGSALPLPVAP